MPCFQTLMQDIHATTCLHEIILNSKGFKDFIYTDRTIQQLKNAGGLRLIDDKEIADSIIAYDAIIREMQIHQDVLENLQQLANNAHKRMIDFVHMEELVRTGQTDTIMLLTSDRGELNQYFNTIQDFRKGLQGQYIWMLLVQDKANNLLTLLHKKGFD